MAVLTGAALVNLGFAPQPPLDPPVGIEPELAALLAAFDRVLTGMAYAAIGLTLFSVNWAGFVLMAKGSEERSAGTAKKAVVASVVGLALVLSAKAVTFALLRGVIPIT